MKTVLLSLLAGVLLIQAGEAQAGRARVVNGTGWTILNRSLSRGALLQVGAELATRTTEPLLLECPDGWVSYSCRQGGCKVSACQSAGAGVVVKPIPSLLFASAVPGPVSRVVDFLWRRQPTETIVAAARAGGNPSDAVLLLDNKGVHWGPALARVLEGRHCFRIAPLPASGGRVTTFSLSWDRAVDSEAALAVPGVAAGLYSLEKGLEAAGCAADPDAAPAWVLVSPAAEFAGRTATWRSQTALLAQLEADDVDLSIVRTVRHAVLASLAEPR